MTWMTAAWRGLAIVAYFVITTVWVPNRVLRSMSTASNLVQDLVVLTLWGGALVVGLWLLRFLQKKGLI